tara:strand:+ start:208 stop:774 length:567 start_codon:yes stop_codon:yes gene_type:complete
MAKPISYRRVGKSINDRCETCRNFSKKTGWCSKWKFVANEDYKCNKWVQSIGDVDQDSDLKEEYKVAIGEKLLNRQENYAKAYTPRPQKSDYEDGFIWRYFAKQIDNPYSEVVEVDAKQYRSIGSKNSGLDGSHYKCIRLQWIISGDRIEVEKSNIKIADYIEKRHIGMIGLKNLLYSNLLRFWEGGK